MSTVIDIAIGLAFIYLLYSLLISIITEILAAWLDIRARMLRKAIAIMLNDFGNGRSPKKLISTLIGEYFLVKRNDLIFTKAGKFYNHPSIKYLSVERNRWLHATKIGEPAYIKKSTFCSVLLDLIREHSNGMTDWDRIKYAVETNTAHFDPETAKHLRTLLHDSDDSMNQFVGRIESWYEETMDRVNGWYKRKVGLLLTFIGGILILAFDVDTIEITNTLSIDQEARQELVQQAIAFEEKYNTQFDTIRGKDDSIRWQQLIDQKEFLDLQLEKSRDVMGTGWDFTSISKNSIQNQFDGDTSAILLKIDTIARLISNQIDSLTRLKLKRDTSKIARLQRHMDGLIDQAITLYSISACKCEIRKTKRLTRIDSITQVLIIDTIIQHSMISGYIEGSINEPILQDTIIKKVWNHQLHGDFEPTIWQKAGFIIRSISPFKQKFWGLLITVLAVSLGAPFWFDLLRKLISVRNVGINTDQKKSSDKTSDQLTLIPPLPENEMGTKFLSNDPTEIIIEAHRKSWSNINGIIGINKIHDTSKGWVIQILCDGVTTSRKLAKAIGVSKNVINFMINNTTYSSVVIFKKGQAAQFLQGRDIANIKNKNNVNKAGWGTYAGIVRVKNTSDHYLLSCAHVLNNSYSSIVVNTHQDIVTNKGKVGEIFPNSIIWNNHLDVGLAKITRKSFVTKDTLIEAYCSLDNLQAMDTEVQMINRKGEVIEGAIKYRSGWHEFKYNGLRYKRYNLFKIQSINDQNVATPGDSGAIIRLKNNPNVAVAILMGGEVDTTGTASIWYACPIDKIVNEFYLELKKHDI